MQFKKPTNPKLAVITILCYLLVIHGGMTAWGAEDPSRFLFATNWYATFTHTLNENGSLNYTEPNTDLSCSATWNFIHNLTVSCQLTPDPPTISHPYFREFIWTQNDSASVQYSDKFEQTCTDPQTGSSSYHSHTVRDVGSAPTFFLLQINTSNQTYSIAYPPQRTIPGVAEITYDDLTVPGNIGIGWRPGDFSTNSLPSTGMVLQGRDLFPMEQWYLAVTEAAADFAAGDPRFGGTHPLSPSLLGGSVEVSWTLTPQVEELELVIEPADYKTWLPRGDLKDWNNPGNVLFVVAALQTKDGNVPVSRAIRFRFELLEVSKEKGVCMNRPNKAFANEDRDLRFPQELNLPPVVDYFLEVDNGGLTATTQDGEYYIVEAAIASYDFGAYGKLKVTAEVNGQEIVGYLNTDGTKTPQPILLPRRQPDSHIADQWKEDNHVTSKGDSADDEEMPAGDGHKGDGLTLYEEYRGFSEGGVHIRANPEKKDFFVSDGLRNRDSFLGIMRFKFATGLEVHWKMQPHEFDVDLSLAGPVKTTVNFNHGAEHVVDQHGIIIAQRDVSDDGASFADALNQGGTPAQYQRVWINPEHFGWRQVERSDGSKGIQPQGALFIAHELAHTCAVWHHGQGDTFVVWTNEEVVVNGQTNEVITEFGVPIELRFEGDFGYVANPIPGGTNTMNVWIGLPQGQHSGDENCFMRYIAAYAYPRGSIRYVVAGTEPIGFELCNSPKGTGVNDALRQYGSRYGDAALLRGNCQSQICVNDIYNGTASHHR